MFEEEDFDLFEWLARRLEETQRIFRDKDVEAFRALNPYILFNGEVVKALNFEEYFESFKISNRLLAKSTVGRMTISTIFLPIDHNLEQAGEPILFESAVFEDDNWVDIEMLRYTSLPKAIEGHLLFCEAYEMKLHLPVVHVIKTYEKFLEKKKD